MWIIPELDILWVSELFNTYPANVENMMSP